MMRIIEGSTHGLPDVERFIERLRADVTAWAADVPGLLGGDEDIFVTRAPGRLDVMGGIADYSGSLVLEMPTQEATLAALQRNPAGALRIVSVGPGNDARHFTMPLSDFGADTPCTYDAALEYFRRDPTMHWAAYVAGAFLVLMRERGLRTAGSGADILIASSVPEGKGVSSSAAIEVATMQAVAAAYRLSLDPRELAILCQKVENLVVGAPCGVMDQMTCACGDAGQLFALLCQPAELQPPVEIPASVTIWGIDSGVRHAVTGADYGTVRVAAFMGYRILSELAGLQARRAGDACVEIEDSRWHGHLANVSPGEFELEYVPRLPETLDGAAFLARYGGTTDLVTRVVPDRVYPVRASTAHPVHEHFRVCSFMELLRRDSRASIQLAGELMYQSHASYSACGLDSARTDQLVRMVRALGKERGLYGAKITGGGSGGTVAVLAGASARPAIDEVVKEYTRETGYQPHVFSGSSPGAASFGYLRIQPPVT